MMISGNFKAVHSGTCQKRGCARSPVYRHHKGDERRFISAFQNAKKTRRPWVRIMVVRYYQFQEVDICRICGDHHEEIHELLYKALTQFVVSLGIGRRPIIDWTKQEVEACVQFLRTSTDLWL